MLIKNPPRLTNRESVVKFLEGDLWRWMKDLTIGFTKINFNDNFQAFMVSEVKIPAGTQIAIANQFKSRYPGVIPTGRFIVRQRGDANIIDGTTPWTSDLLYLQNPSANDAVVSIIFFI